MSTVPSMVYLVPFGTSVTYEQEVEIHLESPTRARGRGAHLGAPDRREVKAHNRQAAAAPLNLGIQPFEEVKTKLEPERASGRREAQYDVAVTNAANTPVVVALDAEDPDNEQPATAISDGTHRRRSRRRLRPRRSWYASARPGRPRPRLDPSCARSGTRPPCPLVATVQFIGYDGYPSHSSPRTCNGGSRSHPHLLGVSLLRTSGRARPAHA